MIQTIQAIYESDNGFTLTFGAPSAYNMLGRIKDTVGVDTQTLKPVFYDGAIIQRNTLKQRNIKLSVSFTAKDAADYAALQDQLQKTINPKFMGTLKYYNGVRWLQIRCHPTKTPPFEGESYFICDVEFDFESDDSYWEDVEETTQEIGVTEKLLIYPFTYVASGKPYGNINRFFHVTNATGIATYPIVEIYSTVNSYLTITNESTGAQLVLRQKIEPGQKVIINMDMAVAGLYGMVDGVWTYIKDASNYIALTSEPIVIVPGYNGIRIRSSNPAEEIVALFRYKFLYNGV